MREPGTPKTTLPGSEGSENLPSYLRPGRLHLRQVIDGKNGQVENTQLQFRNPRDKRERKIGVFVLAENDIRVDKWIAKNFLDWTDGVVLDGGGETLSGDKVKYLPGQSEALVDFLATADREELQAMLENLKTDRPNITDQHPVHLIDASDKSTLEATIREQLDKQ